MTNPLPPGRLPNSLIQSVRDGITPSQFIGQHVKLKREGHEHVGLCPFHQERTPSFKVNDKKRLYCCFSCGAKGGVIDFAMHIYRLPFKEAVLALASDNGIDPATAIIDPRAIERNERRDREHEAKRKSILKAAIRIWNEALPAENSPVERYLRSRAITCPIPSTLRYHPELTYRIDEKTRIILPAMVAQVCRNDEMVAIHRTFLQRDGSGKANVPTAKLMLGDARGAGIDLGSIPGAAFDLDARAVSEGIENGLSYQEIKGVSTTAAGSTGGMVALQLQPGVKNVVIAGDNDEAGKKAAEKAATKWREEGRTVTIDAPALVKDWNDFLSSMEKPRSFINRYVP